MSTVLLLDLKTVPDPQVGKRLLALEQFSDAEAELAMKTLRVATAAHPAVPLQQRRIIAAALVVASPEQFTVLEFPARDEPAALNALESAVAAHPGTVWAWDSGSGYRTQLLARALATRTALPGLLRQAGPRSVAAHYGLQPAASALAELAAVYGLPHRLGLRAAETEAAHARGEHERLSAGSAADALIAYLLLLALQRLTGETDAVTLQLAQARVSAWLCAQTAPHWQQFRQHWTPDTP